MTDMWIVVVLLSVLPRSGNGFWFWSSNRCYERIGCFSNISPFTNAFGQIPQSPEQIKPEFLLYTRNNPDREQFLNPIDNKSLEISNFNPKRKTKIIIHGYIHNGRIPWVKEMTRAVLSKDNVNVIVVNWERGAFKFYYAKAVANTRVIGALTAELIQALHRKTGAQFDTFHLIGHSLGAHVAGYAGERIEKLGRITGLDPAGPLFVHTDLRVRLDPTDATFVDVIHTDGNTFGFGIFSAVGTIDFYPNGGKQQPGCGMHSLGRAVNELTRLKTEEFNNEFSCDHLRAVHLFTSSIENPCEACTCSKNNEFEFGPDCRERCSVMGYDAENFASRGVYYLTTKAAAPYC